MRKIMEKKLSEKVIEKRVNEILAVETTKSAKMKELFNLGLEIKDIAELMQVRYNFVYNVISNMVIVEGVEVETKRVSSKKDSVFNLLNEGKSVKEIAIELKSNYNYIYKLKKEWESKRVTEETTKEAK